MMQLESVTPSEEEVDDSILSYKILEKERRGIPCAISSILRN